MIEGLRTPISELLDSDHAFKIGRIDDKTAEKHGISHIHRHTSLGIFNTSTGALVATVGEDDLYDENGNRFYLDQ